MADPSPNVPDGIRDDHQEAPRGFQRHAGVLPLVALTFLMVWALLGFAGREATISETADGTTAEWHSPVRIRNGEFFEVRLRVRSERPIADLTVEMPQALWEDFTINTFIPAATEETGEDGAFRFAFGPLEPGTEFVMKVDAQINPDILGGNEGPVVILDEEEELLRFPVAIEVLP
jgi:hypothetical protein